MKNRIVSIFLSGVLLTMGILPFSGCSSQPSPLQYHLYFHESGRGGGKVSVSGASMKDGTYWLYWGQDANTNLDNYIYLSAIKLASGNGEVTLNKHLLIPPGATHLLLRDENKQEVLYSVKIPKTNRYDAEQMGLGEVEYTFATISDQHTVVKHSVTGEIVHSASGVQRVLELTKELPNFKFISDTGDLADLPYLDGLAGYHEDVAAAYRAEGVDPNKVPLLIGIGNHETRGRQINETPFSTMLDSLKIMEDERFTSVYGDYWVDNGEGGKVFSYRVYPIPDTNDYAFFFSTWAVMYDDAYALAKDALVSLANNPNTGKIFVYQHMPVYGEAGSSLKMTGKEETEADASWAGLSSAYVNQQQWVSLISTLQNVIIFNGHSHQNYNLGYVDSNYIASDGEGTLARQVYTPALWSRTDDSQLLNGLYDEPPSFLGRYQEVYNGAVISYAVDYNRHDEKAKLDHVTYQPVACLYIPYDEASQVADIQPAEGVVFSTETSGEPVDLSLLLRDSAGEQVSSAIAYRITDNAYQTVSKKLAYVEDSHLIFTNEASAGQYHVVVQVGNLSVLFDVTLSR